MGIYATKYGLRYFYPEDNEWSTPFSNDHSIFVLADNIDEAKRKVDIIIKSKCYEEVPEYSFQYSKCEAYLTEKIIPIDYIEFDCRENWSSADFGNTELQ